jgi:hypothetical protein
VRGERTKKALVCRTYSANSETSNGPSISISVDCDGYASPAYISPDAKLEALVISPDNGKHPGYSPKTFAINGRGFTVRDMATDAFRAMVIEQIRKQDPSITHIDNFFAVRTTLEADTEIYSDSHLRQEQKPQ